MEFKALNRETMEVELSADEIGELLRQNGWKKFEPEAIPKVLIPAVVQIEEDLVGYKLIDRGAGVTVRITDDLRMFLRIHGMDIYDYDGEDLEKAEDDSLQQIVRNQNNVFSQGVAIPFSSMDDAITFCHYLPKGRIRESRLYRMKDRYYIFLSLFPVDTMPGELQNAGMRDVAKVVGTIREYMTLPVQTMESIDILEEHGILLIRESAVGLLADMDKAA